MHFFVWTRRSQNAGEIEKMRERERERESTNKSSSHCRHKVSELYLVKPKKIENVETASGALNIDRKKAEYSTNRKKAYTYKCLPQNFTKFKYIVHLINWIFVSRSGSTMLDVSPFFVQTNQFTEHRFPTQCARVRRGAKTTPIWKMVQLYERVFEDLSSRKSKLCANFARCSNSMQSWGEKSKKKHQIFSGNSESLQIEQKKLYWISCVRRSVPLCDECTF